MRKNTALLLLSMGMALTVFAFACKDKTDDEPIKPLALVTVVLDTLTTGLVNPWGLTFLPDQSMLVTERTGKLYKISKGNKQEISGLPAISAMGQGGLMDITLHPDYATNGWLYFTASVQEGSGISTALFRAKLAGLSLQNVEKLFQADPKNNSGAHFGSRIVFDAQKHVYVCFGERNDPPEAQNRANHSGSVIRLRDDGSLPADNPYVGNGAYKSEIWSYGHRNPQGMAVHPTTGKIWLHEHGPKGGDEINIIEKGSNYGWPLASFGVNYDGTPVSQDTFVEGTVLPIYYWVPSIAPCGMAFYYSDVIPQWKGNLFLGALAGKHLNRLEVSGEKVTKEERLLQNFARFRAVKQGPDGFLYFLTESPGLLCRYMPKP